MSAYCRKLPLVEVFTGEPKGRTVKALRERVNKLLASEHTTDEGLRLKAYLHLVSLADALRPEKIMLTTASDLEVSVRCLVEEKVVFPVTTQQLLVEHRASSLLKGSGAGGPQSLVELLKPWRSGDTQFDPLCPRLGCLDIASSERVALYKKLLWRHYISPMLVGDVKKPDVHNKLASLCSYIRTSFEEADPVEMDSDSAATLAESIASSSVILSLLTLAMQDISEEAVLTISKRTGKMDRSICTCVANGIRGNPFLSGRFDLLVKSLPTLAEYGSKVDAWESALDTIDCSGGSLDTLKAMRSDLCILNASPAAALFTKFSKKVCDHIISTWKTLYTNIIDGTVDPTPDLLTSSQACLAEASTAFPMVDDIATARGEVAECLAKHDSGSRIKVLLEALAEIFPEDGDDDDVNKYMTNLQKHLNDAEGVDLSHEALFSIQEVFELCIDLIGRDFASTDVALPRARMIVDMIDRLGKKVRKDYAKVLMPAVRKHCDLLEALQKAAADEDGSEQKLLELTLKKDKMATLRAAAAVVKTQIKVVEKLEKPKRTELVNNMTSAISRAEELDAVYLEGERDAMIQAVTNASDECCKLGGRWVRGDKWHEGVTGDTAKTWSIILEKWGAVQLDTKAMERSLKDLKGSIDECAAAMDLSASEELNGAVANAEKVYFGSTIFFNEYMLVWHLKTVEDPDALRSRIQEDIRNIRSVKAKEKEHLHPTVFHKALAGLCSKG